MRRPCSTRRAVQSLHYMEGFVGPTLCAGLYRAALHAGLYRPYTIHRVVQAMHYTQGFEGPALCTVLRIIQGRQSPTYSARPTQLCVYCKTCTALRIVQGLHRPAYSEEPVQTCV